MKQRISQTIEQYAAQGIHRTGTDVDVSSAQWLVQRVQDLGVSPDYASFEFERCEPRAAGLRIGENRIEGIPFYDSPSGAFQESGRLCHPDGEGEIVVAAATSLGAGSPLEELRSANAFRALIVVSPPHMPGDGIALANAERFTSPFGIPSLQVAHQHKAVLDEAISSASPAHFEVTVDMQPAEAINVGATIRGNDPDLAPLVVMTPRSGWWQCASERGGGIVGWLEIMRHFATEKPDRDIIFTANTGHELGHTGFDHFTAERPGLIQSAHAWLHLGANFAARDGAVRLQYSDESIRTLAREQARAAGISTYDEVFAQRPGGEARAVYDEGGRYFSIVGGNALFHHPADTYPAAVDMDKAERCCQMLIGIATTLGKR
jgi:hypothetical protein